MGDLLVRLYDLADQSPLVERLGGSGIVIRTALPPEKHVIVDWVKGQFNPAWASECDRAFSCVPVSCFIALRGESCIGFACYETTCRDFFGPVGVAKADRGQGIGTALLWSCLRAMKTLGYAYAVIGGGAGAFAFYSKAAGAVLIEGSTPGIYGGMLRRKVND